MINRLLFFLLLLLVTHLGVGISKVYAVTGGEVQIATNGQDSEERDSAYRAGLRWLLSSRAQDFASVDRDRINAVLNEAQDYVDAFEYIELPSQQALASVPVTKRVRDAGEATHLLSVQYSMVAITAALLVADGNQVSESAPRSQRVLNDALLWLLVRDGSSDLFVSDATTPIVTSRLRELAGGFGWVIDFPALDVTDLAYIGPDEIETTVQTVITAEAAAATPGLTLSPALLKASERYGKDLVLTGFAEKNAAGTWQLRMRRDFMRPDESLDQTFRPALSVSGTNFDQLLQQAMAWNAGVNAGSSFSGVTDSSAGSLSDVTATVYFDGVGGAGEYLRLIKLLENLQGVEEASALEVGQNSLLIAFSPRSALASVSSALQSRDWLRLVNRRQLEFAAAPAQRTAAATTATNTADNTDNATTATDAASQTPVPGSSESGVATNPVPATRVELPSADLFLQVVR